MCLTVDAKLTAAFKKKFKRGTAVTMFKKLTINSYSPDGPSIVTPYRNTPVKAGWLKADKIEKLIIQDGVSISHGIHAYYLWPSTTNNFIKVTVFPEDLIAIGSHNDAVFKKIFISPQELDAIAKKFRLKTKTEQTFDGIEYGRES